MSRTVAPAGEGAHGRDRYGVAPEGRRHEDASSSGMTSDKLGNEEIHDDCSW
jgi:hypothetical protein